jgi:large subunit ribosomal protein L31
MKKEIHSKNYRPVLFKDNGNGTEYIIPSTVETKEEEKAKDGKTYPLFRVEISSSSHPFYTGQEKTLDSAGRVEKFKQKQAKAGTKSKAKK